MTKEVRGMLIESALKSVGVSIDFGSGSVNSKVGKNCSKLCRGTGQGISISTVPFETRWGHWFSTD